MRTTMALMLAVLAACSTNPGASTGDAGGGSESGSGDANGSGSGSNPPAVTDGTRIKARTTTTTVTSSDGASYTSSGFGGWFDSMRGEPCAPAVASDGASRCLPASTTSTLGYFADAQCTILGALAVQAACTAAPKYIAVASTTTCGSTSGPHLFAAGAFTSGYSKSGATCSPITPGFGVYPVVGGEIDPTAFAPMTATTTTTP